MFEKSLNAEKKLKGRTLWDFSTSILSQNSKKLKGALWVFFQKNLPIPKKLKGGPPFSLARYYMLRGKKRKPIWFSFLGQMVQFDTIKFLDHHEM